MLPVAVIDSDILWPRGKLLPRFGKRVTVRYGFLQSPNLPRALAKLGHYGFEFNIHDTSFFLGRRSVVPSAQSGMPLWQDKLFIFLMKNAANPTDFYKIPPGRVVELGAQVLRPRAGRQHDLVRGDVALGRRQHARPRC